LSIALLKTGGLGKGLNSLINHFIYLLKVCCGDGTRQLLFLFIYLLNCSFSFLKKKLAGNYAEYSIMISIAKFILVAVQHWPFSQYAPRIAATYCV
jgi:hypothetical protein